MDELKSATKAATNNEQERDTDEEFNKLRENDEILEESVLATPIKATPVAQKRAVKKKAVIFIYLILFFI